jgi:hypothetical protein
MEENRVERKSHCTVCGKRLSLKTSSGEIRWRPSHVDDEGIYCVTCYLSKKYDNEQGAKIHNSEL